MENNIFKNSEEFSFSLSDATVERKLMRNVYSWMTLALAITALMAYYTASSVSLMNALYGSGLIWILMIAEVIMVFYLSARIDKISFKTAGILFGVYSLLNGMVLSSIVTIYSEATIASAFIVSAGMFGGMALVGSFTKKDLSGIGRFAIMFLIGLMLALIINMFLMNSMLDFAISVIGVLLFAGLTAYDAQKIKQMIHIYGNEVNEGTQKIALMGALSLYLDFINLFLYILRLFGRRD